MSTSLDLRSLLAAVVPIAEEAGRATLRFYGSAEAAAKADGSPVTAAGGICANSRSARPAPNCTDTIPVRIMAAGSTIRDRVIRPWSCPESLRTVSLSPT